MTPTPAPSISPPTSQPGSPQQPSYGGTTTPGRITMPNGHQLTSAHRRPEGTIVVHTIPAPLRRLRVAVCCRPLLRGLALLPAQLGDTIALRSLQRTSSHPDPHGQLGDPQSLTILAGLVALAWPVGGVAGTQLTLAGTAALGAGVPGLPGLLAATGFAARPIVRWRRIQRTTPGDDLAALHGAEHQAINCVQRGLALGDDTIAASPAASPNCHSSLNATDQLIFLPAAVALEGWLPGWPLWRQLLAGLGFYLVVRPLAFELNSLQAAWRAAGRCHGVLGVLSRIGLRRQTTTTTRPGKPAHRELAARALEPLLPPDQHALVGTFPSPLEVITVPAAPKEPVS